jgi:hypothetical protein
MYLTILPYIWKNILQISDLARKRDRISFRYCFQSWLFCSIPSVASKSICKKPARKPGVRFCPAVVVVLGCSERVASNSFQPSPRRGCWKKVESDGRGSEGSRQERERDKNGRGTGCSLSSFSSSPSSPSSSSSSSSSSSRTGVVAVERTGRGREGDEKFEIKR